MNKRKMKGGEGDECPICMEEFNDPTKEITLKCRHKFHKECIIKACKNNCSCSLCRKELTRDEKEYLNIPEIVHIPRAQPLQPLQPGDLGYYFESTEQFKQYINRKLRGYTITPLSKLKKELKKFLGTDMLPVEFIDGIMVFELQTLLRFQRYKFIRLIQREDIPFFRSGSTTKYFEYEHDDYPIPIAIELVEK